MLHMHAKSYTKYNGLDSVELLQHVTWNNPFATKHFVWMN